MLIKIFLQKGTRISLKGRSEGHRETFLFLRFCFYFFTLSDLPSSSSLSFFLAKLSVCSQILVLPKDCFFSFSFFFYFIDCYGGHDIIMRERNKQFPESKTSEKQLFK